MSVEIAVMFYLTTHSTHFIYGYMASDIWLRTILIVRKETRCRHIGYSYRLTARVLLYAPSHIQDSTYHSLSYTSRGALAGTRNSSMSPPHEGSIRRPIAPWANALTTELHLATCVEREKIQYHLYSAGRDSVCIDGVSVATHRAMSWAHHMLDIARSCSSFNVLDEGIKYLLFVLPLIFLHYLSVCLFVCLRT